MLIQFEDYLTIENIYIWTNFGILPFWLMLIIFPNSKITQFFTNSIILPLILASIYTYTIYKLILLDETILNVFRLYLSLDELYTIFSSEWFLLIFWIHFITLNLFLGSWVSRDGVKHNIPRGLNLLPLVLIYFFGPVGIVFYWIIRIFYAKRLSFHD